MADAAHEAVRIFGSEQKLPVYTLEERDYLIRTLVFEAGSETDEGKAAVVHVILNRIKSRRWADTIKGVVTAPWQFEPWMTRRKEIKALSSDDPRYQDAARIADSVLAGAVPDPTDGATHFLNPEIVRKRRGGSLPAWARGEGQSIGNHTFYAPYDGNAPQQASLLWGLWGDRSSC
jgi:conjugal transfer mating pair stabilization protein TraG